LCFWPGRKRFLSAGEAPMGCGEKGEKRRDKPARCNERNPGGPAVGLAPYAGSARRILREHGRDARRREVGQAHSTEERREQRAWSATLGGAPGGKGLGQGKSGRANQVLDSGPIPPATCAGPDTHGPNAYASRPEAGARCGSSARRDLCGRWPARAEHTVAFDMARGWRIGCEAPQEGKRPAQEPRESESPAGCSRGTCPDDQPTGVAPACGFVVIRAR
jgi:hypothetical protein